MFRGDDLTSLQQIFSKFGGGKYELIARDATNSRITARRTYAIAGESLPLIPVAPKGKSATDETAAMLAQLVAKQQAPSGGMNMQTVLALLGVLAPVLGQWLQNQSAASQAALLAQQNLMATVMSTATQSSDKLVTAMAQIYNARPAAAAGGGGDAFKEGMQFMQDFILGQKEGTAEGADEPSLKDMFGLANSYLESQKHQAPPSTSNGSNGAAS
jgi:hypothetical protein